MNNIAYFVLMVIFLQVTLQMRAHMFVEVVTIVLTVFELLVPEVRGVQMKHWHPSQVASTV